MSKSKLVNFPAVKAAITMEQVLEHYGLLHTFKRSGDRLSGPCPIHKGSNPTQFSVSIEKNAWKCFSECKHGGNVLDFIAKMENVSVFAAANKAIEWFHLDSEAMSADSKQDAGESHDAPKSEAAETPRPKPAARPAPVQETGTPNKPLGFRLDKLVHEHPYIAERGLSLETLVDFGAGYCTKGTMAERIAIPIHNPKGEVVAYAGRYPHETPPEDTPKYKLPPGFRKSLELFNIDRASKEPADKPLVIVEGFFGCMRLHQFGCRKVVALMGSTMSVAQEELIRRNTHPGSHVILILDEDEAGRAGRDDIAARLAKFVFVKVHGFGKEGEQPENLTTEQVEAIIGGAS